MPIYQFSCTRCSKEITDILPMGTRAVKCPECGYMATLIPSVPAQPQIKHGAGNRDGFLAPSPASRSHASPSGDDRSVRVYDFEFGSYEKEKLNDLVSKERLGGVSDGYSIS